MNAKLLPIFLIVINCYADCGAALRRTPKVYNALITTDENLTSSRAYPVIQPTIHETGLAHYPFGPYNPYGYYSPQLVRFGQPIAPGLLPREQLSYALTKPQNTKPNAQPLNHPGYPLPMSSEIGAAMRKPDTVGQPHNQLSEEVEEAKLTVPTKDNDPSEVTKAQNMPMENLPIPLNRFGLPPALIPIQKFPYRNYNPINLPPFSFNQYPPIYSDPFTGLREQYLPPYDFHPDHRTFEIAAPSPKFSNQPTAPQLLPQQMPAIENIDTDANIEQPTELPTPVTFENIKNGTKDKNSDVPDVPPPPIPGAKSKQFEA